MVFSAAHYAYPENGRMRRPGPDWTQHASAARLPWVLDAACWDDLLSLPSSVWFFGYKAVISGKARNRVAHSGRMHRC